jgi:hypothetical protein
MARHELDAKPPTELHRTFQEARRSDPDYFFSECLPQFMGWPVKSLVIPASFPRRARFWCGRPHTARSSLLSLWRGD